MTDPNDPIIHDPCRDNGNNCVLTKREYFAAMAMQGLARKRYDTQQQVASEALRLADALIAELNK